MLLEGGGGGSVHVPAHQHVDGLGDLGTGDQQGASCSCNLFAT